MAVEDGPALTALIMAYLRPPNGFSYLKKKKKKKKNNHPVTKINKGVKVKMHIPSGISWRHVTVHSRPSPNVVFIKM